MRGSFERDAKGQDYWVGTGWVAVRMARECAARCRQKQKWDKAKMWDWWAAACAADPLKRMRCKLPPGAVTYERHSKGTFGPSPAKYWKDP